MSKKIAIFSDNLRVGGIQKSLVNIITSDVFEGCEVDVFLYDEAVFFDLSALQENIHIHYLKAMPYWSKLIPFAVIHKLCPVPSVVRSKQYDVAIDFDSYQSATALGAIKANAHKRIMWIHSDVERKQQVEKKYRLLWKLKKSKYKYFDEFAAVSQGIIEPFRKCSGRWDCRIHAIPNLINTKEIFEKCNAEPPIRVNPQTLNIVSVGRLYPTKGYDLMLKDISSVYKQRKDIACYIIGDGPDRQALEKQSDELGLGEVVHFLGNMPNPFPVMQQMDVFCLESRFEGQGMVFWEAQALGLQLVFPRHLEKYNPELCGCEDIVHALVTAQKKEKQMDNLDDYNQRIMESLRSLVE